ncbi:Protein O-linked-mannose beta-1,2-N-acetylglucosaminyltransferase 1 [Thelohanellus kitauei]|uniref:Alpha-1,3-mannosyl-glycoprotein 2-beta-N-acetylglucosaminyltransferase n=1 Tax=Thelohanellus kitauei TaxID=669202 RepID=A0A0C2M0L9_THEKT|nr:Protein O-linked-mannose beta-1,2-N-acetylglucosaminyltransferase 1 [Thelohanellus kitauei]
MDIYLNDKEIYQESNYQTDFPTIRVVILDCDKNPVSYRLFYSKDNNVWKIIFEYLKNVYPGYQVILGYAGDVHGYNTHLIEQLYVFSDCFQQIQPGIRFWALSFFKNSDICDYVASNKTNEISLYFPSYNCEKRKTCFDGSDDEEDIRRSKFCRSHFAFPEFCNCKEPYPITEIDTSLTFPNIADVPIIVIASNRPYYLVECLKSLFNAKGIKKSNIIVDLDEELPELMALINLFDLKHNLHLATCSKECRICSHYKAIFTYISENNHEHVFIFEDDIIVSSDVLYYFSTALNVYKNDDSIFCISAWNDNAYKHSVGDYTMLYRVQSMPGLGLVLSKTIVNEILRKWPNWPNMNWDVWIRESVLNKRACIIPDVSRTFHIGTFGIHIQPGYQKSYFDQRFFNPEINVKISAENLEKDKYTDLIIYLIT